MCKPRGLNDAELKINIRSETNTSKLLCPQSAKSLNNKAQIKIENSLLE